MTNLEYCSIEVGKALGRDLTKEEQGELSNTLKDLVENFKRGDHTTDLNAYVLENIARLGADVKAAAFVEKRNAALNAKAQIQALNFLKEWENNPKGALNAIAGNDLVDKKGSKNGVLSHTDSLANYWVGTMASRLAKSKLLDVASSGALDKQIWMAMTHLKDPEILKTLSKEAVEIANIFRDTQEQARNSANKRGSWIKELPGFVISRSHDVSKISKAGGSEFPVNSPKHREAWTKFLAENLDWEKSMPDVTAEKRAEVLDDLWIQHKTGIHVKFGEGGTAGFKGFGSVGAKLSKERVYHFKTPEAEFEYHSKYGAGSTLLENVITGTMRLARDTAIMDRLGPNAKVNLDSAIAQMKGHYVKTRQPEKLEELVEHYNYFNRVHWPMITGEINIPERHSIAQWSQSLRSLQQMRDLGGVTISALPDAANFGSVMRYTGERKFSEFLGGMLDMWGGMARSVGKKMTPDQMRFYAEAGVLNDAIMSPLSRFSIDASIPGRLSNWLEKFHRLNLSSWWTGQVKMGAVNATALRHAMHSEFQFAQLPEGMQSILRQFDLGESEWNVIRKGIQHVDSDGRKFLNPESVLMMDPKVADSLPSVKSKIDAGKSDRVINTARGEALEKIADNYRALFSEVAAMAVTEPGKMERSMMLGGSKPGTLGGEARRHFWMYKSFTFNMTRRHLGRELHGYSPDRLPISQALMELVSDPKRRSGVAGLANLFLFSSLLGYTSYEFKELSKGHAPKFPTDGSSLLNSFLAGAQQGGGAGIYGDFLFGEMKSRFGHGPLETFLGPTYRTFSDIADLFSAFRETVKHHVGLGGKDHPDLAVKAFKTLLNNSPITNLYYNLFWSRWFFDYAIVYRLQEMMNPGSLQRMEDRLRREKDREFIVPPSRVIPRGGRLK
jgi:hypothetical protein